MAESILSNVAAGIISKLGSLFREEMGLWCNLKDDFRKLSTTVSTIKAVLLHAEEQSIANPLLKHWLGLLTEAMYDAEDLLDEISTEALGKQLTRGSKTAKKVRLFFSSSNQLVFGLKMGHKVRELRQRFDEIAAEKDKFHLEERYHAERERGFGGKGRDQTHSSPPQVVIGRDHDKESIVDVLRSSDYVENVSVVPIVGIGGLGKTTLAQLVYNDDRVLKHFDLKMWVCVSDDFDVKLLVKKVIECAPGKAPQNTETEMEPLKNLLHEKINGRRYLLVLDDVWNDNLNKWLSLKDLLAGGARGSKIVITTRLKKVADISRPVFVHELSGLSENEAWSLFKQMAFKQGQPPNSNFEATGKEIVAKCCGVPLAIKTIGGMLYFKDLESEWLLFKDKELSKIDVFNNDILPILKLSYNHLPSHYKRCFAYCSLYPKDFEIPVEDLILQWQAHGYLKTMGSNECVQDIGFGYVMDLFQLSFFQDAKKDKYGNIKCCKMHDLMHDLAISVAGDNFSASFQTGHSREISNKEKTQHISFRTGHFSFPQDFFSLMEAKRIRTLLPLQEMLSTSYAEDLPLKEKELDTLFCNLKCLRVLSLRYIKIHTVPSSIVRLNHIRYLDLCYNFDIKKLPNSVTILRNLQVLRLQWCICLVQLPNNISKLVNLTSLDNQECDRLTHMPRGIGQLTRLEKLSLFVVSKDHSIFKPSSGGLDELQALNNLRGELAITNLGFVKNVAFDFKAADLSSKKQLQKLRLCWNGLNNSNDEGREIDVDNDEMGLEALRPHHSLKDLSVQSYGGAKPPTWLLSLTNLVRVSFANCRNIRWLPSFDGFPYLKELVVFNLSSLEYIDIAANFEKGGSLLFFPSLTALTLVECPNLKGFLSDDGTKPTGNLPCFPCLSKLEIGGCPNLTYLPLISELKDLTLSKDGMKSVMEVLKKSWNSASQSTFSPFSILSQLQHLKFTYMYDSLEDELLQWLPSLEHLRFEFCLFESVDKGDGMQWQSLKALRSVEFVQMWCLASLPKGLQYVPTLQHLYIWYCKSLMCIPEWMSNLVALQDLAIYGCRQLEERCKNNTVEDWPKISHIPNIYVGGKTIQRNGCYLL